MFFLFAAPKAVVELENYGRYYLLQPYYFNVIRNNNYRCI